MGTDFRAGLCGRADVYRHPLVSKISGDLQCLAGLPDPMARRSVRWTPQAASLAAVLMGLDPHCSLSVRCEDTRA